MRTGAFTMTSGSIGGQASAQARTARDGRRWTLRPARPTDSRGLARLFADVRREGRWLLTPPSAVSEPSEAFFIGEMIRNEGGLALVAEADGEIVGNVLVNIERSAVSNHVGTLSIVIADGWRDVGVGSEMVRAAQAWVRERGLAKLALAVFPDNARAIAVYEHAGFVREGLRRRQYRGEGGAFRDELLMAWFPEEGAS
ncbi:MAG TPA: GNAT family protein [candidate division Zixibacteria bacterium]|nr:GNAT family protein [candidate division Zixibacteria bacterium]